MAEALTAGWELTGSRWEQQFPGIKGHVDLAKAPQEFRLVPPRCLNSGDGPDMAWTIQIDPILLLYIRVKPDKNSDSCRPWINIGGANKYLQTVSATLQARGTDGEIAIRRT